MARKILDTHAPFSNMGLQKDFVNGIVSLLISVTLTVGLADADDGPWSLS